MGLLQSFSLLSWEALPTTRATFGVMYASPLVAHLHSYVEQYAAMTLGYSSSLTDPISLIAVPRELPHTVRVGAFFVAVLMFAVLYSIIFWATLSVQLLMMDCDIVLQKRMQFLQGRRRYPPPTIRLNRNLATVYWVRELLFPSSRLSLTLPRHLFTIGCCLLLDLLFAFTRLLEHTLKLRAVIVIGCELSFLFHATNISFLEHRAGYFGISSLDFFVGKIVVVLLCFIYYYLNIAQSRFASIPYILRAVGVAALIALLVRYAAFDFEGLDWELDTMKGIRRIQTGVAHANLSSLDTITMTISTLLLTLGITNGRENPLGYYYHKDNSSNKQQQTKSQHIGSDMHGRQHNKQTVFTFITSQALLAGLIALLAVLGYIGASHTTSGNTLITHTIVKVFSSSPPSSWATIDYILVHLIFLIVSMTMLPALVEEARQAVQTVYVTITVAAAWAARRRKGYKLTTTVMQGKQSLVDKKTLPPVQQQVQQQLDNDDGVLALFEDDTVSLAPSVPALWVFLVLLLPCCMNNHTLGIKIGEITTYDSIRNVLRFINQALSFNFVLYLITIVTLLNFAVPSLAVLAMCAVRRLRGNKVAPMTDADWITPRWCLLPLGRNVSTETKVMATTGIIGCCGLLCAIVAFNRLI